MTVTAQRVEPIPKSRDGLFHLRQSLAAQLEADGEDLRCDRHARVRNISHPAHSRLNLPGIIGTVHADDAELLGGFRPAHA
jgi:hypothetical protein